MPTKPRVIVGLISDTHGLLRPEALEALAGCDLIVHAGDIGKETILERLNESAPTTAVRGNIDVDAWTRPLPETTIVETGETLIYVLHDLNTLDLDPAAAGFLVVISGHTHKPMQVTKSGVLYVNPGSAGPRRFQLPVTIARLDLPARTLSFIDLTSGEVTQQ